MNLTVPVDGRAYEVTVEDVNARPVVALVEGERFEVWPDEARAGAPSVASAPAVPAIPAPAASAAPTPGARPASGETDNERTITAPIPGVIVAMLVAPGSRVEVGQEICTLEAMKMKNSIRSTRVGTIAALRVAVGDHVRHGQVLAEFGE